MNWLSSKIFGDSTPAPPLPQEKLDSFNKFIKKFSGSEKPEYGKVEGKTNKLVGDIFLSHLGDDGKLINPEKFTADILTNYEKDGVINGLGQKALKHAGVSETLVQPFKSYYEKQLTEDELSRSMEFITNYINDLENKNQIAYHIECEVGYSGLPYKSATALMRFFDIPPKHMENLQIYTKVGDYANANHLSEEERRKATNIVTQFLYSPHDIDAKIMNFKIDIWNAVKFDQLSNDTANVLSKACGIPYQYSEEAPTDSLPKSVPPSVKVTSKNNAPITKEELNLGNIQWNLSKYFDENHQLQSKIDPQEANTNLMETAQFLLRMKGQAERLNLQVPEQIILQTLINQVESILSNGDHSIDNVRSELKKADLDDLRKQYINF